MANRSATVQSTVEMPRWAPPGIVTLAAMAALMALTADAAARQARPAPLTESTAPRDAGEPIMAIVSIKSQQVTFYDANGWILRAPVSTGITGRETPAGVFAVIEKDKDHHSTLYDDAWMPNMQRITWNGIALHGGPLPGYAASHGCVRIVWLGDRVRQFDRADVECGVPRLVGRNTVELVETVRRREALAVLRFTTISNLVGN
jgi:lipoprotein-anchoring transpeptidase ErfK/SrfK